MHRLLALGYNRRSGSAFRRELMLWRRARSERDLMALAIIEIDSGAPEFRHVVNRQSGNPWLPVKAVCHRHLSQEEESTILVKVERRCAQVGLVLAAWTCS